MKISIIVPVYNVEKYLNRCLTSLINQSIKDIEIIVVNDGSPDNSQDIIDEYKKKYPTLIINYIKSNGGLSDARNFGIDKATGEYIAFLDSDDYVDPFIYEKMYNKAKMNDFDLVVCDLYYDYDGKLVYHGSGYKKDLFEKDKIKKSMLDCYPVAWNKLYKRSLFGNSLRFIKGLWYEDVEFFYRLISKISKIGVINEPLIYYVQRDGAITKTFDNRLLNYIDVWNSILNFYLENNLYEEYRLLLEYCYVRYLYGTLIKNATNYRDKKAFNRIVNISINNVKKNFPKYRRNSYFYYNFKGIYLLTFNRYVANLMYFVKNNVLFLKKQK